MNYVKWLSLFIFASWLFNLLARFLAPDEAYFKLCAGDIVTLLCIITLELVRSKKK